MSHRNPELSARAKALRSAASSLDMQIDHTRALELLSRMDGHDSRHSALIPGTAFRDPGPANHALIQAGRAKAPSPLRARGAD